MNKIRQSLNSTHEYIRIRLWSPIWMTIQESFNAKSSELDSVRTAVYADVLATVAHSMGLNILSFTYSYICKLRS